MLACTTDVVSDNNNNNNDIMLTSAIIQYEVTSHQARYQRPWDNNNYNVPRSIATVKSAVFNLDLKQSVDTGAKLGLGTTQSRIEGGKLFQRRGPYTLNALEASTVSQNGILNRLLETERSDLGGEYGTTCCNK